MMFVECPLAMDETTASEPSVVDCGEELTQQIDGRSGQNTVVHMEACRVRGVDRDCARASKRLYGTGMQCHRI